MLRKIALIALSIATCFGVRQERSPAAEFRVTGFDAIGDTLDVIPPDSNGAISENFVVSALNNQVRIQGKNGEQVKTASISAFWAPLDNPVPFDPRTIYDSGNARWVMAAVADRGTMRSSLLVGVSKTADPSGSWDLYRVVGNTGTGAYMDFPALGMNKDLIAISCIVRTNIGNHVIESRIYVFERERLYAGETQHELLNYRADTLAVPSLSLSDGGPIYFIGSPIATNAAVSELHLLSYSRSSPRELRVANILTNLPPWAAVAPNNGNLAPQLGTPARVHMQDAVIQNVVGRNGRLWFSQMVFLPADNPTRAAIQWGRVRSEQIEVFDRLDDASSETSYAYPSIAVNLAEQVCIGYTKFSAADYPSAACSIVSSAHEISYREVLLKRGLGAYFRTSGTGKNRWGDYSSTHVDPADQFTFWTIQEYACAPSGDVTKDGSGRWATWWGRIGLPGSKITPEVRNGELTLHIAAAPGFQYQLETASDLAGNWEAAEAFAGRSGLVLPVGRMQDASRFFRVRNIVE